MYSFNSRYKFSKKLLYFTGHRHCNACSSFTLHISNFLTHDTGIGKEVTGICPNSWHVWRILNNYLVQIEDYASDTVTQQQ